MNTDPVRDLLRWLTAQELTDATVILACDHAGLDRVPRGAVGVRARGCLAGTGLDLPAQLLAVGVPGVRVLACPAAADLAGEWAAVLDGVTALPEPPPVRLRSGPVFDLAAPELPRRLALGLRAPACALDLSADAADRTVAALRLLAAAGRARLGVSPGGSPAAPVAVVPGAPPARPDRTGAPAPGAEPVVAGPAALAAGGAVVPPAGPAATLSTSAVPMHPAIALAASGCTACGVCVRACPNGALVLDVGPEASVLRHVRENCRDERACVPLCPVGALSVLGPLDVLAVAAAPAVDLAVVATAACARCGAAHPAGEGPMCAPCAFRAANPFGSRLGPMSRSAP